MSDVIPENLRTLHEHEEQIRNESLIAIRESEVLERHLGVIHDSMNMIFVLARDHVHADEEELAIQYLGIRLFNAAASSVKLALSGYYQNAFSLVRDIVEVVYLIDYFKTNGEEVSVWRKASTKERLDKFGAGQIRNALNKRDGHEGNRRKAIYGQLSEYSTHATAPGFVLLAPNGKGEMGSFFFLKYMQAWIEDLSKYLSYGAVVYMRMFPNVRNNTLIQKYEYLSGVEDWMSEYLGINTEETQQEIREGRS